MKIILAKQFCLTLLLMHFLDMLKTPSTFGLIKFRIALYSSQFGQLNIVYSKWESSLCITYITMMEQAQKYLVRTWQKCSHNFTSALQSILFPYHSAKQEFWMRKDFLHLNPSSVNSSKTGHRKLSARFGWVYVLYVSLLN